MSRVIHGFFNALFSKTKPTKGSNQEDMIVEPKLVEGDISHSRFYLPDEFLVLKVESTLFRVPKLILNQHSPKFRQLLSPTSKSEASIQLDDIRAIEFERFLSILLPTEIGQYDISSFDEWSSVLKVAHKWDCSSVRKLAIDQITPLLSAVDKVVIGHQYGVHGRVSDGYIELCQSEAPISPEDGHRLGVEDVVHISNIRFQLLPQTGARIQNGSLPKLCLGPKRHLLGSNRVLSFIGRSKNPEPNSDAFVERMDKAQLHDLAFTPMEEQKDFGTVSYLAISAIPHHREYSFEELRLYDYIKGRKSAPCPPIGEVPTLAASHPRSVYSSEPTPNIDSETSVQMKRARANTLPDKENTHTTRKKIRLEDDMDNKALNAMEKRIQKGKKQPKATKMKQKKGKATKNGEMKVKVKKPEDKKDKKKKGN